MLSIALITIYFREPAGGSLHQVQSAGATVLKPFEVAAERVARPFRDAYNWSTGLVHAKSENKRLRKELDVMRQQAIQNTNAERENATLRRLLRYVDSPRFPQDYDGVATSVIGTAPTEFQQQITIAAGKTNGVRVYDPVVTDEGLVGQVTRVAHSTAQVTLLTDDTSAVSALDLRTNADGVVGPGESGMEFSRVSKDQQVFQGDELITAGWKSKGLSSTYPKGIPIGRVTYVGQNSVDLFKQVEVQPFVKTSSLTSVVVLVPRPKGRP